MNQLVHVEHPELACVSVSGKDAKNFLQNLITQDIRIVDENNSAFSLLCDGKGRVEAQFILMQIALSYHLIMHTSLVETIIKKFKQYQFRSQVQFSSDDYQVKLYRDIANQDKLLAPQAKLPVTKIDFAYCAEFNQDLFCLVANGQTKDRAKTLASIPYDEWRRRYIESEFLWLSDKTNGQYLSQSLRYDYWNMLSFSKGCYIGQEIVNRVRNFAKSRSELKYTKLKLVAGGNLLEAVDQAEQQISGKILDYVRQDNHISALILSN